MLLFIKGYNNISYASKSRIYVVFLFLKPYSLRLKKESKLILTPVKLFRFWHNSVHVNGSISWTNLPFSFKTNQALNEFELKLKNLETFTVGMYNIEMCFFIFLAFSLRIVSKYLFVYCKLLKRAIFCGYPVDAS